MQIIKIVDCCYDNYDCKPTLTLSVFIFPLGSLECYN